MSRLLRSLTLWCLLLLTSGLRAAPGDTAVFFGSFDPFHNGHLVVVRDVAAEMGVDEVLLVPYPDADRKAHVASYRDRLAMARAVAFRFPEVGVLEPAMVAQAVREGGASGWRAAVYRFLYRRLPANALVLDLMGMDQLHEHLRRRSYPAGNEPRMMVVVDRPGVRPNVDLIRSSGVPPGKFFFLHPDVVDVDSARLRTRLGLGDQADDELPRVISMLVKARGLYRR